MRSLEQGGLHHQEEPEGYYIESLQVSVSGEFQQVTIPEHKHLNAFGQISRQTCPGRIGTVNFHGGIPYRYPVVQCNADNCLATWK